MTVTQEVMENKFKCVFLQSHAYERLPKSPPKLDILRKLCMYFKHFFHLTITVISINFLRYHHISWGTNLLMVKLVKKGQNIQIRLLSKVNFKSGSKSPAW